jgi:prepilin-type N-terminal cleavage/methylation domain-containing protein
LQRHIAAHGEFDVMLGPRPQKGFTLIELLVVIGIIGVLVALLLPALSAARRAAANTTCAAQLRQLATATVMYLNEHKHYPDADAIPAFAGPAPVCVRKNVMNAVGPYLSWPELSGTERVDGLPAGAACNVRLEVELLLEPYPPATFGLEFWNTGYSYCAGLMECRLTGGGPTTATAIRKDRLADRKGRRRGVLWADNLLHLKSGGASLGWAYFHIRGAHEINPALVTVVDPKSYAGHHTAWSDGSVDFLPRGALSLDPGDADTVATYKVGGPGLTLYQYF